MSYNPNKPNRPCKNFDDVGIPFPGECGNCGWMVEAHCGSSLHNLTNLIVYPCSNGDRCVESVEYKQEARLNSLMDRLEAVVERLNEKA